VKIQKEKQRVHAPKPVMGYDCASAFYLVFYNSLRRMAPSDKHRDEAL